MSGEIPKPNDEGFFVTPRGAKSKKRWNPKEWRPEYTAIVAVSCTGLDNETVGRQFGYTKEHISNILNTDQAVKLRAMINKRLLETANVSQAERIDVIRDAALKNIENVILSGATDSPQGNPLQIFDRSFKFLQSTGDLAPEKAASGSPQTNIQNNFVLSDSAAKMLSKGLTAALEVQAKFQEISGDSVEPKRIAG